MRPSAESPIKTEESASKSVGLRPQVLASSLTASITEIVTLFSSLAGIEHAFSVKAIISAVIGPSASRLIEFCVPNGDISGQVFAAKSPRPIYYAIR